MKLWQRIALSSLVLILIAVNITALIVMNMSFSYLIDQQQQKDIERHQYLEITILNKIAYERLQNDTIMLTPYEVENVLTNISDITDDTGWAIYDASDILTQNRAELIISDIDFQSEVQQNSELIYIKSDIQNDQNFIIIGSTLIIEGNSYYLYSINDTTELFTLFNNQTDVIKQFSIIFSCAIAIILILITLLLLYPLTKLNKNIKSIADGDYSLRTKKSGSPELNELSKNIDSMATSVQNSVNELQEIVDSRTRFTDNFAHEMKTPLTSIMCFADLLRIKRNVSEQERQEYASIILEETNRMKALSSKLLEISNTNRMTLDLRQLNLKIIIQEIAAAINPIMQQHNISFEVYIVDSYIFADKALFKSLIFNLLDNAIKASNDNGKINLTCYDADEFLKITIQDFGIGMTQDNLKKITEPFYMVDKSRSRKVGGAGLGLALCESIAKAHNATLSYQSELSVGTTVTLKIPKRGEIDETN